MQAPTFPDTVTATKRKVGGGGDNQAREKAVGSLVFHCLSRVPHRSLLCGRGQSACAHGDGDGDGEGGTEAAGTCRKGYESASVPPSCGCPLRVHRPWGPPSRTFVTDVAVGMQIYNGCYSADWFAWRGEVCRTPLWNGGRDGACVAGLGWAASLAALRPGPRRLIYKYYIPHPYTPYDSRRDCRYVPPPQL